MATPQFANIGATESIPLQSIKPVGTDTSDNVSLQTLDSAGYTVDNYLWVNWAGDEGDQEAWIDSDTFEIVEGVEFAPGTGLWIQGSSVEQGIQSAGKVGRSDVVIALRNGGTIVGNPFPTATNLQEILPEGDDTSDNVSLQTLDSAGYTVDNYLWVNWAGDEGDQEAWIDSDTFEIVENVTIAAGQGVCNDTLSDVSSPSGRIS